MTFSSLRLPLLASIAISVTSVLAAELPGAKYTEWTSDKEIFVPMRDGIHLSTERCTREAADRLGSYTVQ